MNRCVDIVFTSSEKEQSMKKGLLQNAVFRPKRKIYLLKKLARTTTLTVLANFFGDIIFENFILQQALFHIFISEQEL